MQYQNIFLALCTAIVLSSCATAYKSSQTPDDVYYSPTRPLYDEKEEERNEIVNNYSAIENREIMMGIRNRKWRNFNDPFGYNVGYGNSYYGNSFSYYNSPYNYCFNNWGNYYGYYYNPYYYPFPIYNPIITKFQPKVVTIPRMVNLNAYSGYDKSNVPKNNGNINWNSSGRSYNNSNSRVGNVIRKVIVPSSSRSDNNDSRSYNPSKSSSGGSSGRSSSSGSGSISRPSRGR